MRTESSSLSLDNLSTLDSLRTFLGFSSSSSAAYTLFIFDVMVNCPGLHVSFLIDRDVRNLCGP